MEKEKMINLVIAAQNNDQKALNELFHAFYNDVYYFALKTVKDEALACDITQDSFIDIINALPTLQEPAAFAAWIKQITYHQCTRYFRKKKDVLVDEDEDGNTVFDILAEERTEFIPDEALDQQDFRKTILAMLDELSEAQRAATLLYYYDELSVKQIAKIQGVSEGTVKSRLNYARKSIKNSVETYEKKNNVKLHSFTFLPFMSWLLKGAAEESSATATVAMPTVISGVSTATGTTLIATAGSATAAAGSAATGAIATGLAAKIAAGILAVAVAFGGTALYLHGENHTELPEQTTATTAPETIETTAPETTDSKSSTSHTDILNELAAYSFEPCDVVKNSDPADLYCQIADIYLSPKEFLTVREFMDRIKESKLYDDLTFQVCLDLGSYEFIDYAPDCPAPSNGYIFVLYKDVKMFDIEILNPTNATEIKDCYAFEIHDLYYYHSRSALDIKDIVWYYNGIPYSAAGYSVDSLKDNLASFTSEYLTYENEIHDAEKTFIRTDTKYEKAVFSNKYQAYFDFEWSYRIICNKSTGEIERFECTPYARLNTDYEAHIEVTDEYIKGVFYFAQEMYHKYIYGRTSSMTELPYTTTNDFVQHNGYYLEKLDDWDSYEHFMTNLKNRFSKATVSEIVSQIQLTNLNGEAFCNFCEGIGDPFMGDYIVESVERISEVKYKLHISFLNLGFEYETVDMYCIYEGGNWVIDGINFYGS